MSQNTPARLLVIGGGAMAEAILLGAIRSAILQPASILIAEPDPTRRQTLTALGLASVPSARDLLNPAAANPGPAQFLLAVKPQSLDDVARDLAALRRPIDAVVISILAGKPSAAVQQALGPGARVVRVMPNLPARIGKGTAAVSLGAGARPGDDAFALALFQAVGDVVPLPESMLDAFTALAGSGPAYVFYLAQAMTKAATDMGFDPPTADAVVRSVVAGAGALLAATPDKSPADLRAAVTSKGGTTEAAARVLDDARVMDTLVRAILAARDRAADLAR